MIGIGQNIHIYKPEFPIKRYTLNKSNIKYEDDDILIVYKEPGVNSVPTPMSDLDNILTGVNNYMMESGYSHISNPIHRLDAPTKGLIIFGKNKQSELRLYEIFKARKIKKLYLAVTKESDNFESEYFIDAPVTWKDKTQEALTYIRHEKNYEGRSYFVVYPLTGRIHQIRKHMSEFVAPIIGDALYGEGYTRNDEMELSCFYYKFPHPLTGKIIEIKYLEDKYEKCSSEK